MISAIILPILNTIIDAFAAPTYLKLLYYSNKSNRSKSSNNRTNYRDKMHADGLSDVRVVRPSIQSEIDLKSLSHVAPLCALGRFAFDKTPRGPRCARQARQRLAIKSREGAHSVRKPWQWSKISNSPDQVFLHCTMRARRVDACLQRCFPVSPIHHRVQS